MSEKGIPTLRLNICYVIEQHALLSTACMVLYILGDASQHFLWLYACESRKMKKQDRRSISSVFGVARKSDKFILDQIKPELSPEKLNWLDWSHLILS